MTQFEISPENIIAALRDELAGAQENRLLLMAMVKQLQSQYANDKDAWAVEKASLLARIEGDRVTPIKPVKAVNGRRGRTG